MAWPSLPAALTQASREEVQTLGPMDSRPGERPCLTHRGTDMRLQTADRMETWAFFGNSQCPGHGIPTAARKAFH